MEISIAQVQIFLLALTRVLAILAQIPVLSGTGVPNQVKIALGILFTMVISPGQYLPVEAPTLSFIPLGMALLNELIIGLLAGFAINITFSAFQMAAKVMEIGSGFGSGQMFNPALGNVGSALDQLFVMISVMFFFASDGYHIFFIGLQRTFEIFPIMSGIPDFTIVKVFSNFSILIFAAVQMALPVFAAIILADLTLGLLARVAPQIQVFFLGLPLKIWLGLIAMYLTIQIMLPIMESIFGSMGNRMLNILGN
ncbi:MAG: flagellar biosynthetic protein FliR [Anaerolineaceae bacterium]|nr:flagellar biosynthetic protein FliR [Anaerolineaceae bacterium]